MGLLVKKYKNYKNLYKIVKEKSIFIMNVRNGVYFYFLDILWTKKNLLETDINIEYFFLLMLNNVIYVILINMNPICLIDMYALCKDNCSKNVLKNVLEIDVEKDGGIIYLTKKIV